MAITLISTNNTTTSTLGGSATFTGTFDGVEQFAQVVVIVNADVASATDGLRFIWSNDGVTDHLTRHKFTYGASDPGREFVSPCLGAYFRVEYENGGSPQGSFSLQTIYRDVSAQIAARRLADSFDAQELALTTRTRILDIIGGVDTGNSSTATLAGGATFTGTGREVKDNRAITVTVYADQDSASGGLKFDWSTDNSNWDLTETYTIAAGVTHAFTVTPKAQYHRMRYVNGATPQGAFRLETIAQPVATTPERVLSVPYRDLSGTITLGGTAQTLEAANGARKLLFFQNTSDEEQRLRVDGGIASATRGIKIAPYGSYESPAVCPTGLISLYGATTGKSFEAYTV